MGALAAVIAEILATLYATLKLLAIIAATVGLFELLFDPKGQQKVANFIGNVVKGALSVASPIVGAVAGDLRAIEQAFVAAIQSNSGGIVEDLKAPLGDFAQAAFTAAQASLEGKTNIKPADWAGIAATAFSDAAAFGLSSFAISALFEAAFPEKLNTLNSVGPLLSTMAGFAEVTEAALRPLFRAGIAIPSQYDANSKFRSILPNLMQAQILYSRRMIDAPTFAQLLAYAGISPDYVTSITAESYRPLQPRALATAIQDTAFPTDTMRAILEDNGLNPSNVTFFLDLLQQNSTRNVRNAYVSEAITAYADAVVADDELDTILTSVNYSDDAKAFVKNRALLQRRVALAKNVESQVIPLVAAGGLTSDQGLQQLEAAGVQPWLAQLKITLATTRAEVTALKKELSLEARNAAAQTRNLTRAAVAQYQAGTIDDVALTAALELLGLPQSLVASILSVQTATRAGRMKYVYGQLLDPEDAKVLTDRVAAIEQQLKKGLIDVASARSQLAGLKVDGAQADALLARWAAGPVAATPAGTLLNPLTGT